MQRTVAPPLPPAPIIVVALDLSNAAEEINEALREAASRALTALPSARLACLNVLKQSYIAAPSNAPGSEGRNKHVNQLVALQHWAQPLKLKEGRVTFHVLEAADPATAILTYAGQNKAGQILIGARQSTLRHALLGSVSAKVAGEASCTVTVVRPPRSAP
jgi:nucleotide-binding universal stress UspA family protein